MKSDLNIDSQLAFSLLLEDEMKNLPRIQYSKSLEDLLMLVFKEGVKCGQRHENHLYWKEISK
jgi:hypothetical protein